MKQSAQDNSEEEKAEYRWDIKRVFVGITAILILFSLGYYLVGAFEKQNIKSATNEATLGVSSSSESQNGLPLPEKEKIEEIISEAKATLSKITSDNITSSQAAVQKVIKDLEELQGQNKKPIDVFCEYVCKGN